ncbi:hypothetical protein IW261DRAFT_1564670 [Armillaria novae-zelandiae]|uniref:Uncharacterized protein n=1 Tax=Armillaria novae-zelandiae TaxID=153914 RepID=A0AA39TC42_9AGAR|nr:hypothetical protein IW261DRAFT_1564670 [Armillaria novae-zelandiae]
MPTLHSVPAEDQSSDINKILGPLLIGCFLNLTLYIVLCNQVYIYYLTFPKDRLVSKCTVSLSAPIIYEDVQHEQGCRPSLRLLL